MKKMLLFVLLFAAAMTFDAAGQTPAVYIEDLHAVIGSQVEIPVRVEDFQNVGATTIDYAYDPAVLTFFDYDDPQELGGFVINAFNTGDDYWIRIAWNDLSGNPNGVSLADGSKFISIIFTYHGGVSTFSFVEANCTVLLLPAFEEIYLNTSNGSIDETIAGVVIPDMYVLPGQIHVPILVNFSTINYGAGAFTFAIVFNDDHLEFTGLANTAFTGILPYHDGGTSPVYLQWENSINPLDPHDGKFLHGLLLHMVFNFTGTQDTPLNFDLDYCVVSNNQAYTVNVEYTNGMLYYCPELTADISASDVTCNGAGDGSIAITNAAGAPSGEYEYRLDDGAWQSADVFNNLIPGTYTVYIRDAVNNYCEYELGDATVVEPYAIDVFFTIDGNPLLPFQTIPFCFDIEEIFLAVVNEQGAQTAVGEPPFAIAFTVNAVPYLLENITYGVQVNLVDYLPQGPYPGQIAAGEYLVEITSLIDANNCSLSEGALAYYKFTLLINPQPDVFFIIDDNPLLPYQTIPYCFDIDQIMLTLVNEQGGQPAVGTPPFMIEFTINGGTSLVFENQNYNDDINLVEFLPEGPYPGQVAAGSYEVQVTGFSDANGCGLVPNAMQYYNFTLVINPQPDVFLTIDDVPLLPFSEHEYCYNTSAIMLALVDEQGGQPAVGTPPFMIEFKINGGTPIVLTDVEYDVDISLVNYLPFGPYPGQIAAGSYEVQVTGFSDANGCGLVPNAMQYYNFTLMINPQPVVSDASLQYSSDNEVSWDAAGGSFEGGFEICLDPVINEDEFYYLDVNTFITSEALAENFLNPFYLTDASSATFVSWWTAKFAQWSNPAMEAAMQSILDGTNPMFYIKYTGSDYQLIDGFMYLLTGNEQTLRLDSDYPPGNYTFTGAVTDVNTCVSEAFNVVITFKHHSFVACPEDITVNNEPGLCTAEVSFEAVSTGVPTPSVTFEVDGSPISSPHTFPVGITVVNVSSENDCGVSTCSFTVTVIDAEEPIVPADGFASVECLSEAMPPVPPTIMDNCSGEIEGVLHSMIDTPEVITCNGTRVYTYSYTDGAENTVYWSYTYTIERSTFPVEVGGPVATQATIECTADVIPPSAPVPQGFESFENLGITGTSYQDGTFIGQDGSEWTFTQCRGDYEITGKAIMLGRNRAPQSEFYSGSISNGIGVLNFDYMQAFSTNVDLSVLVNGIVVGTVTSSGEQGIVKNSGDIVVNIADDFIIKFINVNNSDGQVLIDNVSWTTYPSLTAVLPVVEDVCGNILPAPVPVIVETFDPLGCQGTIRYEYTYTDCAGLQFEWSFTYTIEAPVVEMPDNAGMEVSCPSQATQPTAPVVADNCGRNLELVSLIQTSDNTEGCTGTIVWTATYKDCNDATYFWTYTYTVLAPVVEMPENGASDIACPSQAVQPTTPVVADNCDRNLDLVSIVQTSDNTEGCTGTIVWTATYKDCNDATYFWTYTYTVLAPVVEMPENGASDIACPSQAVQPTAPVVADNCGRNLELVSIVQTSDNTAGCTGTIVWTATYKDCNDATYFWTYTYTVLAPVVEMPANLSMVVACPGLAMQLIAPEVLDNCGRLLLFIGSTTTNTYNGCEGSVTYIYNYQDCAGNSYSWTLSYDILPLTGPLLVDENVDCSSLNQSGLPYSLEQAQAINPEELIPDVEALYTDNCGGEVTAVVTSVVAGLPGMTNSDQFWYFEYVFTISDGCGNTTTCSVTYSGSIVPETVVISQGTVRKEQIICYGATETITISGLQVFGSLQLIAGQSIHLLPGFKVHYDGYLHAYISDTYCENPEAIVVSKETEVLPKDDFNSMGEAGDLFRIFPNPTTGTFILEMMDVDETSAIVVEIYNILGERIIQHDLFGYQQYEFNISDLSNGVYVVRTLQGDRFATQRIIKQ